jgi:hypothetical protein
MTEYQFIPPLVPATKRLARFSILRCRAVHGREDVGVAVARCLYPIWHKGHHFARSGGYGMSWRPETHPTSERIPPDGADMITARDLEGRFSLRLTVADYAKWVDLRNAGDIQEADAFLLLKLGEGAE